MSDFAAGHDLNGGRVHGVVDYLRISITDRCNLRCRYCMPPEGVERKGHDDILTYEEITRFVRTAAGQGISRVRITGGEPLVRRRCVDLVAALAAIDGIGDLALTTNGILLADAAGGLAAAGLDRVNISIDSLDAGRYASLTRGGELAAAVNGLEAALAAGLEPVKVNVVILTGLVAELDGFMELVRVKPLHLRFIELMPVNSGPVPEDFMSGERLLRELGRRVELSPAPAPAGAGPARYFSFPGAAGTLGLISLGDHFCSRCNRLRLTADGRLRNCLFAEQEMDIRSLLEEGTSRLAAAIAAAVDGKRYDWRLCRRPHRRTMAQIGG